MVYIDWMASFKNRGQKSGLGEYRRKINYKGEKRERKIISSGKKNNKNHIFSFIFFFMVSKESVR